MPATSAPFGLRPVFHPSGLDRPIALAGGIQSVSVSGIVNAGYATNIFKGQPVALNTAGYIVVATAGSAWLGAFAGCEWTDGTGRRRVSNYWPANETFQTGSVVAYYYTDPNIVYEIQADGTLAQTSIGDQANLSNVSNGSTTTGLSQCTMSTTLAGTSAVGDLRIVNLAPYVDNAWGDAYVIVQVQISRSQYVATINAI
jgi:hypothetical protein